MKNIALILIILLTISCAQTKDDKIKESIESYLLKYKNNPKSYEFVSMEVKSSIAVKERKIIVNEGLLKEVIKLENERAIQIVQTELEFLKYKDDNFDAAYIVNFVARGENSFGAIIKKSYSVTVLNNETFTVVRIE